MSEVWFLLYLITVTELPSVNFLYLAFNPSQLLATVLSCEMNTTD